MALVCLLNPTGEIVWESCTVHESDKVFNSEQECVAFKTAADLKFNELAAGQAKVADSICVPMGKGT